MMNLKLYRKTEAGDTVLGELFINGEFFCYTLEDKIRSIKIMHETCIDAGEYEIVLNKSQRFKEILPLLLNVPKFIGIRMHAGNSIEDTSGCVLVGTAIRNQTLLNSRVALDKLMTILLKVKKNEKIIIDIINPVPFSEPVIEAPPKIISEIIEPVTENPVVIPVEEITIKKNKFTNFINLILSWIKAFYQKS